MVLNAAGKVQHRYLYGPGTDALLVDEVFNASGQAERGYWTVADHLGTVHELIESDADGTPADNHKLVEHRDYDASGKLARVVNGAAAVVALDYLASDFPFAGRAPLSRSSGGRRAALLVGACAVPSALLAPP